jgi:outer membrane receptor protein involved in Fe transport
LTGAYRYSSYKTSRGGKFNTDTYKFGVEFAPIRDIRFRAGYNRAVRAPNLQELFATQFVGLDGVSDPCAKTILATDLGCIAQGLRVGQKVVGNPAGQYNGLLGGLPSLRPEIATTKSVGVILQPSFAPKLALTIDYFDIKVANAIQAFGADAILNSCTTDRNPLACGLIHRNPVNGSLWLTSDGFVTDLPTNIGSLQTRGIDINASYATEIGKLGNFSFSLVGTYLNSFKVDNGLTEIYDCVGLYGPTCSNRLGTPSAPSPKWRHKFRVSYAAPSGIGLSFQWRYFGPVGLDLFDKNTSLNGPNDAFSRHLASQSYFDLSGSVKIADKFTMRIGVNNLFDRQPPLTTSGRPDGTRSTCTSGCNGNTYPAVYDALGRYIFAGVTLDF